MWIKPLSSNRQNTVTSSSSTLTPRTCISNIRQALLKCNFPPWALNNLHTMFHHRLHMDHTNIADNTKHNNKGATTNRRNLFLVLPYSKCLSKRFSKTYRNLQIQVHFKESNTIHSLLMAPKDKDSFIQKSGVIYRYKCTQADCEEEYIREFGRTFGDRLKEHLRSPFPYLPTQHMSWDIPLV